VTSHDQHHVWAWRELRVSPKQRLTFDDGETTVYHRGTLRCCTANTRNLRGGRDEKRRSRTQSQSACAVNLDKADIYWSIADLCNSRAASCRIAMDPHQHTAVEARPSPWRWLVPQRKPRKQPRTHSSPCTPRIHVACDMSSGISSTLPEHVYVATPVRASPRLVGKRVRKSREASGGLGVRHGVGIRDSSRFLDIYPARYVTFLNNTSQPRRILRHG
jgi:hypothetical protein